MEVQNIPIPAPAAIKVTKEGKQGVFETKIIQTTDNKYIYCLPVRRNNKVVNFSGTGLTKEIKVYIKPGEVYVWRNISIARFVEDGRSYLKIRTRTPGVQSMFWQDRVKEEEEQKELLKKYEEQEAQEAEAAKKAEEEKKSQEAASNSQSASTSSSSSTGSSTDNSLYASWSEKIVGAEQSDTAILNEVGASDDFNTKMAKQEARYQLWDGLLNQMWQDLKASLPEDQMSQLTSAQVDWIHQKEAMISQYWESQNVDHSGFNEAPAADTTKQRVYYLLDYCPRSN